MQSLSKANLPPNLRRFALHITEESKEWRIDGVFTGSEGDLFQEALFKQTRNLRWLREWQVVGVPEVVP